MIERGTRLRYLKQAIWLYLILLVFEGALRKWLLPGLSTPLLLARDPIAAFILFEAVRVRMLPQSASFYASFVIAYVAITTAVFWGHGNPYVALYGARPFLLHFPAMFVIALALDRDDLVRIGKFLLVLSIGMTVLIAVQFYSPQAAFVNRGVGGEGSAGFSGALGYFRPPGTFSFTSGVAQFYALVTAFLLYFWLNSSGVSRLLLLSATLAVVVALPVSVSRTLIFQFALAILFFSSASLTRPKALRGGMMAGLVLVVGGVALMPFDFFQTAIDVIQTRFINASVSEGGLDDTLGGRYFGGLIAAFMQAGDWPFWGMGIGMGTSAGAALLSGKVQYLIAEGEWQRLMGELGFLLGLIVIGMRLAVCGFAAMKSGRALLRGDLLPWMLLSNAITVLPQGNWGQPTSLGFSTIAGGLLLASLVRRDDLSHKDVSNSQQPSLRSVPGY